MLYVLAIFDLDLDACREGGRVALNFAVPDELVKSKLDSTALDNLVESKLDSLRSIVCVQACFITCLSSSRGGGRDKGSWFGLVFRETYGSGGWMD